MGKQSPRFVVAMIAGLIALPCLAGGPEAALLRLTPAGQEWVKRSCPSSLGPSLWSSCITREASSAAAGKPDLSKLKPELKSWIERSCPDSLGPSLAISCLHREKSAVVAGLPDISFLTKEQRQWVLNSCSTSLGPSLFKTCVGREANSLRGSRSIPQQSSAAAARPYSPPSSSRQRRGGHSDTYEIEVAHDDELFIINGEKFEAQTYCLGWEEGDEVMFLDGSPYGACASAVLLNLRTKEKCDVWCE